MDFELIGSVGDTIVIKAKLKKLGDAFTIMKTFSWCDLDLIDAETGEVLISTERGFFTYIGNMKLKMKI